MLQVPASNVFKPRWSPRLWLSRLSNHTLSLFECGSQVGDNVVPVFESDAESDSAGDQSAFALSDSGMAAWVIEYGASISVLICPSDTARVSV